MENINWDKPVRTKSGHPVRILCTDSGIEDYPVVGIVGNPDERREETWTLDGTYNVKRVRIHGEQMDLENVPEKHVRYMCVYHDLSSGNMYEDRDTAKRCATGSKLLAIAKIEFEEGEGLDDD